MMNKQQCPPGFIWNSLVKDCIDHNAVNPVTEAVVIPLVPCWNTAVWISVCVIAVLSCSVLVLLLWVIIYRFHTHGNRNSECPYSYHCNLKNVLEKEDFCPHINGRKQEVFDCEMDWGQSFCETRMDSAVPLPATELGDSALVTTKTAQLM